MMDRYIIRKEKNDEGTGGPSSVTNICENAHSTNVAKDNKLNKRMLTSFETSYKKMKITRRYSEEYLESGIDFPIQLDESTDIANCATLSFCQICVAK